MRTRDGVSALTGVVLVATLALTGCTYAVEAEKADIVGTWELENAVVTLETTRPVFDDDEEGGTITFSEDSVRIDSMYISPLDKAGIDQEFTGSGTWTLGKSVHFTLTEYTVYGREQLQAPETYSSSFDVVMRDGEMQLELVNGASDYRYHMEKIG